MDSLNQEAVHSLNAKNIIVYHNGHSAVTTILLVSIYSIVLSATTSAAELCC